MRTLKLIAAGLLLVATTGHMAAASEKGKKNKKHTCTEACKKEGKCTMAHGEKGHTCTDACKKADKKV